MARTDTDVIVTQYRAEYSRPPARATVDFGRTLDWRITGPWEYRETLARRRRWTVVRDLLADCGDQASDITDTLRGTDTRPGTARGLWLDGRDPDARAVLIRDTPDPDAGPFPTARGVVMLCQQVTRPGVSRVPVESVSVGDAIRRQPGGYFLRVESIERRSFGYVVAVGGPRAASGERWTISVGELIERQN